MSLSEITARIRSAERAAGQPAGSVTLIAVSKVQSPARIETVLQSGHAVFGENRVQEAAGRWPTYRERFPDLSIHLIGPLQTNKIKQAVALFDAIHSIDRLKLARRLADEIQSAGAAPDLFVQVNTGEESQKAGVLPSEADDFIKACRDLDLQIGGAMAIPPATDDPKRHFCLLADIAARNGISKLSMGMSADFELAIACGATHVRVGSAIFGARAVE